MTPLEKVARAIWTAQREEDFPDEGTIQHAHGLEIARAAILALADNVNDEMAAVALKELPIHQSRQALGMAKDAVGAAIRSLAAP